MTTAAEHCRELVRAADKDRFLASLFAPDDCRPHLLALYAFDLEIARISHLVSEPHVGLIRQQWWLDTLDGIYEGNPPPHPVAEELARAVVAANLPPHALKALVTAREFDLYADPMPDIAALEAYLGETSSAVIQLASLIVAGDVSRRSAEAAGLAGVAFGLARLLHQDPPRHLPPGMDREQAKVHARRRLAEARALAGTVAPEVHPAFLPVCLTELYLVNPQPSQFRRQFRMWMSARKNKF